MNFIPMFNNSNNKTLLPPKSMWTKEEDELLTQVVTKLGARKWNSIAEHVPGRNGKQCRERWMSHISPDLKNPTWTLEEDQRLINLHETYGNKWSKLTAFFQGRPPNAIKNRWNCILRKNKREMRLFESSPLSDVKEVSSPQTPVKVEEKSSSVFDIFSNGCNMNLFFDDDIEGSFFTC